MTDLVLEQVVVVRGRRIVLHELGAAFAAGELVGIVGANGAGKTSLLLALAGIESAASGSILLDGTPLAALDARSRARRIAFVDGLEPADADVTVGEAVGSARFAYHRWWEWQPAAEDTRAREDALERVALVPLRGRELRTLSAGERQRVWIAVAIAQQADVVLLDEPTSHLDLRYAVEILGLMRDLAHSGKLVFAVLHSLEEAAAFCDRILVLGEQRILADGAPASALRAATIERAFGIPIDVQERGGELTFVRRRAG